MFDAKCQVALLTALGALAACGQASPRTAALSSAPGPVAGQTAGQAGGPSVNAAGGSSAGQGAGGSSAAPMVSDACTALTPQLANGNAQALFDAASVPTFDFFLPDADWAALQVNARDEQYVPARACFEGQLIGEVGLRFKGYYGSLFGCFDDLGQQICPRLSMKVEFDEYDPELSFLGLERLNFNAYRYDDSRMKERLSYDLFRSLGVVAPRASWTVLRVNGVSMGLYGIVEQIDGRFTRDRWPEYPDGNLYKEIWPTETTDPQLVTEALKANDGTGDVSAFVNFSAAILGAGTDAEEIKAELSTFMDLDYLARFMAAEDALASYDGVTYFWTDDGTYRENHNFYIYEHEPSRFTLLPWDVEATFWINPDHAAPHWTEAPADCALTYPYWEGMAAAPGCDPIFHALQTDLAPWRAASRELLDGPFSALAMNANIDRHVALIGDLARTDPTPTMYGSFDESVENLRVTVPALRARLEGLIAVTPDAMDPSVMDPSAVAPDAGVSSAE